MIKVNGNLVRELIVVECRNNKWNEIRMRAYTYDIRNRFVLKIEIRCDKIGKGMNGERGKLRSIKTFLCFLYQELFEF